MYLAELRNRPEEKYAVKSIRKDRLIEKSAIQLTFLELGILMNAEHQFLTHLLFFFQTSERLYFVMPFVGGGELSLVLKQ